MVKALALLILTAGAASAQTVEEARQRYLNGEYAGVFEVITPAAEAGDASAQNLLGNAHYFGFGLPQDCALALAWTQKAADQGLDRALFNLARYYDIGCFAEGADPMLALDWYRRAVAAGVPHARIFLAELMASGRAGAQDPAEILAQLDAAVTEDTPGAALALARILSRGQGVPADRARALEVLRPLAFRGEPDALHELGLMYEAGLPGDAPDLATAHALLAEAVNSGSTFAVPDLARMKIAVVGAGWHDPAEGWALCLWVNARLARHPEYARLAEPSCEALRPMVSDAEAAEAQTRAAKMQ